MTATAPSTELASSLSVEQAIVKDYKEESGFQFGTAPTVEQKMLAQKYGILPPQITDAERKWIAREERKDA